jgi:hypothetical protein
VDVLKGGDATLERVRLTIDAGDAFGDLVGVDARLPVGSSKGVQQAVFRAWTAPPEGVTTTRCILPVSPLSGLTIVAASVNGDTVFAFGAKGGPMLREGNYVIVPGAVNWNLYSLAEGKMVSSSSQEPAAIQNAVLTIERA